MERKFIEGNYSFVSIGELVQWTDELIKMFPESYDIIVGIPRSGMLVASLIAVKLGKPLTTPDLFDKQIWMSGVAGKPIRNKRILLIDDSVSNGKTMSKNAQILGEKVGGSSVTRAVVIASEEARDLVDLYYKIVPQPRIFEWNLLHHKRGRMAVDFDGVLCEEPQVGLNQHEDAYLKWMKNAKPYLIPSFKIDFIISNRLERHRAETEAWLQRHDVSYEELVLWDINEKSGWQGKKAQHKIDQLKRIKPDIFWESGRSEAEQIWESTKIPTFCVENKVFFS